jgi:3-hydroxybutyryl-CoA dehydratase
MFAEIFIRFFTKGMIRRSGKRLKDIKIGEEARFSKTISESDIYNFIGITGDINPIHIDEVYAKKTMYKKRIAHGMLTAGLISTVIGNELPGPGTIYLEQKIKFTGPVFIGDTITAIVKVLDLIPEKNRAILDTICINQENTKVIVGEATVLLPR